MEFYEKGLNWEKSISSTDNLVLFPLGGIFLGLYPRKLLAEDATVADDPAGFSGITFAYNAKEKTKWMR